MIDLNGKTALVGGASQGIGQATAIEFAKAGAKVILMSRNAAELESTKSQLTGSGHQIFPVDLTEVESLPDKIGSLIRDEGAIEIFVHNSGGPKAGPVVDATPEQFIDGLKAHVIAGSIIMRNIVPGMKEKGYGRLINIISTSVKIPIPNLGVSNTIRGAVASWSKTLANELGPHNITVNNVLPGYTETPRLTALLDNASKKQGKSVSDVAEDWRNKVPLRRFASPIETAHAALFLASPMASYISGVSLPVDGGRTGSL